MRKYIGLTIFFVWLVWLSFRFAFSSWKIQFKKDFSDTKLTNIQNKNTKIDEKATNKNTYNKENTNNLNNTWNNLDTWDNLDTWNNNTWNNLNNKNEEFKVIPVNKKKHISTKIKIIPEHLYIWLTKANLVKDSKYEEIYALFKLDKISLYKIENKEIYVKQLSWNYLNIKNKLQNIIQQIWGNIAETNLYGNKQVFLNPNIYYKKYSIMLVKYWQNNYLITFPYNKYSSYKNFMKNVLFVE